MTASIFLNYIQKNMQKKKAIGMEILSTSGTRIPLNLDWSVSSKQKGTVTKLSD
jgi:hypothetical protein